MNDNKLTKPTTEMLGQEVVPTGADRYMFNRLTSLPNPDPILRRIGRAESVYASIMADAHVKGDVRSIRGDFRSQFFRVNAGDDKNARSQAARDLCEQWLKHSRPNVVAQDWLEVMWQQICAVFYGYRVHEVVWDYVDSNLLPIAVKDRANSRFTFDLDGNLLLKTIENSNGMPVEPYQFIVSRHMATCENPYGDALLSSCFWPWTFKTGGFKFFMQYCEKYGIPTPVGKYPAGATETDRNQLEDALANVLNSGYIMAPVDAEIALLETTGAGNLPQESLIDLCNREMSKALTSQAMVSELHGAGGSQAASQSAAKRQSMVNNADHDIAAMSFGEIFRWITVFNFGEDVAPPTLKFLTEGQASLDRVNVYKLVADLGGKPSKAALMEEANIPVAQDEDDAILPSAVPDVQASPANTSFSSHDQGCACGGCASLEFSDPSPEDVFMNSVMASVATAVDTDIIEPFAVMLARYVDDGQSIESFSNDLGALLGNLDKSQTLSVTKQTLELAVLQGLTKPRPAR